MGQHFNENQTSLTKLLKHINNITIIVVFKKAFNQFFKFCWRSPGGVGGVPPPPLLANPGLDFCGYRYTVVMMFKFSKIKLFVEKNILKSDFNEN